MRIEEEEELDGKLVSYECREDHVMGISPGPGASMRSRLVCSLEPPDRLAPSSAMHTRRRRISHVKTTTDMVIHNRPLSLLPLLAGSPRLLCDQYECRERQRQGEMRSCVRGLL